MKYVLSLPGKAASSLSQLKDINEDWQAFSDPPDSQLGSGEEQLGYYTKAMSVKEHSVLLLNGSLKREEYLFMRVV